MKRAVAEGLLFQGLDDATFFCSHALHFLTIYIQFDFTILPYSKIGFFYTFLFATVIL